MVQDQPKQSVLDPQSNRPKTRRIIPRELAVHRCGSAGPHELTPAAGQSLASDPGQSARAEKRTEELAAKPVNVASEIERRVLAIVARTRSGAHTTRSRSSA